jgi:UDP-N-acetyl-D-galactosamine dehydrogenase
MVQRLLSKMKIDTNSLKLAVIGLGYVGLPLALEFAKKRSVVGFDTNKNRVKQLNLGVDKNYEFSKREIKSKKKIIFSSSLNYLKFINCYIVTVPTPIDKFKNPDLKPLLKATKQIGKFLKKKDIVIFESTVYPGCVEEVCAPLLEKFSKLKYNKDFFCGYSPERINPGDKKHTISNIKKITSGSNPRIARLVDNLYSEIIIAGTHKAPSIKVAEAAKVIENTQRDVNIALINELSIIFNKLSINTDDVLNAAKTKWNFLPFKPGLVGGHCIGVDPYYLTYKAKSIKYHPKIILAGRDLNDNMGNYVALELIKKMKEKKIKIKNSKILIMGLTFKENCADLRNSGIQGVIVKLQRFNCNISLYDPWANSEEVKQKYNIFPKKKFTKNTYDAVIIALAHKEFKKIGIKKILYSCKKNHVLYDLKNFFKSDQVDMSL